MGDKATAIVCVDVNGVLDTYTGWRGEDHWDPPRPGARDFLAALNDRGYRVVLLTTRWAADVWEWLRVYELAELVSEVTDRKPPAHVFIDDRAIRFDGDFERTLGEVSTFLAHWERLQ